MITKPQKFKPDILIRNAQIVTMNPAREIFIGDVLVKDGHIADLGDTAQAEIIIDAQGMTLTPGFIQTHVHLCQTLFRNSADDLKLLDWLKHRIWPFENAHDADSLRVSARLGLAELIRGGTTTVLDMGTVRHNQVIFEEIQKSGMRAISGKCLMDTCEGAPTTMCESIDESLKECEMLIDTWHGQQNGRIQYALAPRFALSCSEELLRAVAEFADEKGLRIHSHAAETQEEVELVLQKTGKRNIDYLAHVGLLGQNVHLAHCIWLDKPELRLLAETETRVLHCPSANLKLGSGVAMVPEMLKFNISVSLGADGAPCNNNLDIFHEMRLAALIQKPRLGPTAMSAMQVFELATIAGAKALNLDAEIGSIEVGKKADLVLINTKRVHNTPTDDLYAQLVYSGKSSDVELVMVDGQILFQYGKYLFIDPSEIVNDAESEWQKLLRRVEE